MNYQKPELTLSGSAISAIESGCPEQKSGQVYDQCETKSATGAYEADE
jgi:hypothetical protein